MNGAEILRKDARMRRLVDSIPADRLHLPGKQSDLREYLVGSIVSQQLSVHVARIIYGRFIDLYGGTFPENARIIETDDAELRGIGLSTRKVQYIKASATFFEEESPTSASLAAMDDEAFCEWLTRIPGVGRWTAEMVLMFGLCRPDVFSPGDYGIQVAMKNLYRLDESGAALRAKMERIAVRWKPYRSLACLYLWAWKDQEKK
ncbi:MAG: DNA-3-methyladenine glycosylase 2 family protein [Saprospiraceae bacterium]|nr:DNA-3-methyladenine glycosylase 2 family protein [Saprospiraceae bacterium]MBP9208732.1 DNA-3-methyladenine glycosylase 2 family protein [Saprospiraceae bacterium]MBV6472292.1 putative bifunctional transcriptional activator/DNA repair enzyme AlkA [Saprospiraceae bacterium]